MSDFISSDVSNRRGRMIEKAGCSNRILSMLAENLELLTSVILARFIIWRELRRRKHEERVSA
ncbi:MAG: hypothetical protein DMF68_12075 [Acidobacteria bacterium]|nr:MAG: hypothetical protein DMF68_12075 [Acidobacteriota bacterium]